MELLGVIAVLVGVLVSCRCSASSSRGSFLYPSSGDERHLQDLKTPCNFPAIFNFGDSNSDTGGIYAAFYPAILPYGETYFGKAVGRASDGRLIIDFIAERLKTRYLSGYLDSFEANFAKGVNFATGGATIRHPNETWFQSGRSPFPLDIQTAQFNQFKARTIDLYTQKGAKSSKLPKPEDFSKALYIIDIGQNDLADGLMKMNVEQLHASLPDMINQLANAIQSLYQQGARAFWIHSTGPIGCLPYTLTYFRKPVPGYLDQNGCIKSQNDVAMEFNRHLKDKILKLRKELRDAALTFVDVYAAKYALIGDAKKHGFEDPAKICCGYYKDEIRVLCSRRENINGTQIYGSPCKDPSKHISWDGVHYTEAANRWIFNYIADGSLSDPRIPITHACHQ